MVINVRQKPIYLTLTTPSLPQWTGGKLKDENKNVKQKMKLNLSIKAY